MLHPQPPPSPEQRMIIGAGAPLGRITRRDALATAAAAVASLWLSTGNANANGLRDFLQSRQRIHVLAPIYSSRQRLAETLQRLGEAQDMAAMRQALQAVRMASMNCYLFEASALFLPHHNCTSTDSDVVTMTFPCTLSAAPESLFPLICQSISSFIQCGQLTQRNFGVVRDEDASKALHEIDSVS